MTAGSGRLAMMVGVLVALAALAVGCGEDDDDSGSTTTTTSSTTSAVAASPQVVTMADFSYSPSNLTARAGQQVSLDVRNAGAAPHTLTIDDVADTTRVEAGASKPLQFTPAQAGALTFYCTVHGRAAMSGTITVTQ